MVCLAACGYWCCLLVLMSSHYLVFVLVLCYVVCLFILGCLVCLFVVVTSCARLFCCFYYCWFVVCCVIDCV